MEAAAAVAATNFVGIFLVYHMNFGFYASGEQCAGEWVKRKVWLTALGFKVREEHNNQAAINGLS